MSSISFSVTNFDHEHLQEIGKVYTASHAVKGMAGNSVADADVKTKTFKKMASKGNLKFVLAHQVIGPQQQKLQGFACFEKTDGDSYLLHDLCTITPKGSGVGAAILNVVFQHAVKEDIKEVNLQTTAKSQPFYEQLFFENIAAVQDDKNAALVMRNSDIAQTATLLETVYSVPKI